MVKHPVAEEQEKLSVVQFVSPVRTTLEPLTVVVPVPVPTPEPPEVFEQSSLFIIDWSMSGRLSLSVRHLKSKSSNPQRLSPILSTIF